MPEAGSIATTARLLVAVVGPTAVGKSAVALEVAEQVGGEIVSADSRQVYIGMDIGTAKPSLVDRQRVPHHLVDIVAPDEAFTVAHYRARALAAIEGIFQLERVPLLVGGSGLYVKAITQGLTVPAIPPDPEYRRRMEERAQQEGAEALFQQLQAVDRAAAERIHPANLRRVIRALEVFEKTGRPFSRLQQTAPPPFDVVTVGLTQERGALYEAIDLRVDRMFAQGLVEETARLFAQGYAPTLSALSSIGYKQAGAHLHGVLTLEQAIERTKFDTHRYVRQQSAWFSLRNPAIRWFDVTAGRERAVDAVRQFATGALAQA